MPVDDLACNRSLLQRTSIVKLTTDDISLAHSTDSDVVKLTLQPKPKYIGILCLQIFLKSANREIGPRGWKFVVMKHAQVRARRSQCHMVCSPPYQGGHHDACQDINLEAPSPLHRQFLQKSSRSSSIMSFKVPSQKNARSLDSR